MDVLKMRGVLVDVGTYYWTGLGTTRFSVVMSNFGNQMAPSGSVELTEGVSVTSFQAFAPPTMFRFGFAFEPIMDETHILTTSLQLNHPKDNSENVSLGAEYSWAKMVSFRAGYKVNVDEQPLTFGGGVATSLGSFQFGFDYSFVPSTNLGNVHTISMNLKL
jgi:hypothetical protein